MLVSQATSFNVADSNSTIIRYSIISAALVAFAGLASVFPGTDGAPVTNSVSARHFGFPSIFGRSPVPPPKFSPSGSKSSPKKGPPRVASGAAGAEGEVGVGSRSFVVDPTTRDYTLDEVNEKTVTTGDGFTLRTARDGHNNDIGVIGINDKDNAMAAWDARNNNDATPNRIPLHGLLLGFWTKETGKDANLLQRIRHEAIDHDDAKKSINDAYAAMGIASWSDKPVVTIRALGTGPGEKEAFETLLSQNPFGVGARKTLTQYIEMKDRMITEIVLSRPSGSYNMDIKFGPAA